jgi:hypothetical protein
MQMIASLFLVAAQVLFQTGVQDVEAGKLDRARLTLQTLIDTYPEDPLAPDAKAQIDAINLYEEGLRRMREGRFEAAEFTFHTLLSVYPESPVAKQAEAAMHGAAQAQQELNVCLKVRALDLNGLGLSAGDTQKIFVDHEVRLAAGKPFDPRDVEQARLALTGFLGARVRTEVRMAGAHEVDVVLERVK